MTLTNGNSYAYQWDVGLMVATTEDVGTKRRFANEHGSKAFVVEAVYNEDEDTNVYHIPDILLATGRPVVSYKLKGDDETVIYVDTEDFLPVRLAPKPDNYVYTEEELRVWAHKLNKPAVDGVTGEVILCDENGEPVWGDVDYSSHVVSKPSINGETLIGSKNGHDFGLANLEDIPEIPENVSAFTNDAGYVNENEAAAAAPVQSVNGRTGDVVVDAGDLGGVPDTRKVNGYALSSDVNLDAEDVGAIEEPSSADSDDFLVNNGSAWVPQSIGDTVGKVESLMKADTIASDSKAYSFRRTGNSSAKLAKKRIVGGTIVWNQMIPARTTTSTAGGVTFTGNSDGSITLSNSCTSTTSAFINLNMESGKFKFLPNHIYYVAFVGNASPWLYFRACYTKSGSTKTDKTINTGTDGTIFKFTGADGMTQSWARLGCGSTGSYSMTVWPMCLDLTLMFGKDVADAVYAAEQITSGFARAWFRRFFPAEFYPYSAPTMHSVRVSAHKTVGFNLLNPATWTAHLLGGVEYQIDGTYTSVTYAVDGKGSETLTIDGTGHFTPVRTGVLTVTGGSDDTIVHFSGTRDGEFEAYNEHIYSLDDALVLNGLPTVDGNNNLVFQGDTYDSDGSVVTRYGIVDLGSLTWVYSASAGVMAAKSPADSAPPVLTGYAGMCSAYVSVAQRYNLMADKQIVCNDSGFSGTKYIIVKDSAYNDATTFKTAMNGQFFLYPLNNPQKNRTVPYTNPQEVDAWGTEEFIDEIARPFAMPVGHETEYIQSSALDLKSIGAVQAPASILPGQKLAYDGTDWKAETPAYRELNIQRYGRLLDEFVKNERDCILWNQCATYRDGHYYACGDTGNSTQVISVWDSTGVLETYNDYTELGHGQGITSTEDYLIVANGTGNTISVVDRSDLSYIKSFTITGYGSILGIGEDNGTIYFLGYRSGDSTMLYICTLDYENETFEEVCSFPHPKNTVRQGFTVYGEYGYAVFNRSNMIYKIHLKTGTITNAFYIPDGDARHPVGEAENLFVKDGEVYLYSALYYTNKNISSSCVSIGQIWSTDLIRPLQKSESRSYMHPQYKIELTVNGNADYEFNPDLTFTTWEEACHILNYHRRGRVTGSNITIGYIQLVDGQYSIRAGTCTYMDLFNSAVRISQVSITDDIYVYMGDVWFKACEAPVRIETHYSDIEMLRMYFTRTTSISVRRSQWTIRTIKSLNSDIAVDYNERISTVMDIKSAYVSGMLKLLAAAGTSTDYALITVRESTWPVFDVVAITDATSATDVVHVLNDHPMYDEIIYNSGKVYLRNKVGYGIAEVTSSCFVEACGMAQA